MSNLAKRIETISKITFKFDPKVKDNFYATQYFLKAKNILEYKKFSHETTMQFIHFNDEPIMMCGEHEIKQLLKFYLTDEQLKRNKFYFAKEGSLVNKNSPLLIIKGNYLDFMCLENIIDGILCRRCSVATNCYYAKKELLAHQEIIYMADRSCDYFNQPYDAYAAYLGGLNLFVSQAQVEFIKNDENVKVVGTMPHALIQQYQNNINELILDFSEINNTKNIFCLLDYENNVIKTLEEIKNSFEYLGGIRLDTSSNMIDKSLENEKLYGVNNKLIKIVKEWLVNNNLTNKKIIVTSNINTNKIKEINQNNNYVDYFGIGSYFLKPSVHISADLVEIDNKHNAKEGRKLLNTDNLFLWKI